MSKLTKVLPVILCGGSGTRLWPVSRSTLPKQFVELTEQISLFQQTIQRVSHIQERFLIDTILVVGNDQHKFLISDQLRAIENMNFNLLLEPEGRNTAPALTMAALEAVTNYDDPILVVSPADHLVKNVNEFIKVVSDSIDVAKNNVIAVLGVNPTYPETGYGYIRKNGEVGNFGEYSVSKFIEKPSLNHACEYVIDDDYFWNCGVFVLKASLWLKMIEKFRPDILHLTKEAWARSTRENNFICPNSKIFRDIPVESIDYAVMEPCIRVNENIVKVLPLSAGWTDFGTWNAVEEASTKDNFGNSLTGDVILRDSKTTFVHSTHRLIAGIGLENLLIIETPDAVLIASKSAGQDVKKIVQELKSAGRSEIDQHRKVFRPWGWYDTLQEGASFKVKRILVNPHASLSLQSHKHRAEHWVVVKGEAEVTNGNKTFVLRENESTYIPKGQMHRLSNTCKDPLEIIEVQSGEYLDEDDIFRYEDVYGRGDNS